MTRPPLKTTKAKKPVWIARNPLNDSTYAGCYVISSGDAPSLFKPGKNRANFQPGRIILHPLEFTNMFHGIRLRPGEGPVKITISANQASTHEPIIGLPNKREDG